MKKSIKFVITILLLCLTTGLSAQSGLRINDVFRYYANKHGSAMVQLSEEVLKPYNMTFYKSLSFRPKESGSYSIHWITDCIDIDKKHAKKIKETMLDGNLKSGYYQLGQLQKGINRFILFKINEKRQAALIYIEGELDSAELVSMLFSKKQF
jgi:hypothetical protein